MFHKLERLQLLASFLEGGRTSENDSPAWLRRNNSSFEDLGCNNNNALRTLVMHFIEQRNNMQQVTVSVVAIVLLLLVTSGVFAIDLSWIDSVQQESVEYLSGNVTIASTFIAGVLVISPGARITVLPGANITVGVGGAFVAVGNSTDPIVIESEEEPWTGIIILGGTVLDSNKNYVSGSVLSHVHIVNAETSITSKSDLYLEDCEFYTGLVGLDVQEDNSTQTFNRLTFHDFSTADITVNGNALSVTIEDSILEIAHISVTESSTSIHGTVFLTSLSYYGSISSTLELTGCNITDFNVHGAGEVTGNTFTGFGELNAGRKGTLRVTHNLFDSISCIELHCLKFDAFSGNLTVQFNTFQNITSPDNTHAITITARQCNSVTVVDGNTFQNIEVQMLFSIQFFLQQCFSAAITNNKIRNCTVSVLFFIGDVSDTVIKYNSVVDSTVATFIKTQSIQPIAYLTHNYWGEVNAHPIRLKIVDGFHNPVISYAHFSPFCSVEDCSATKVEISGHIISEDLTSPISVSSIQHSIVVLPGVTFTLIPGTANLTFSENCTIIVLGSLSIEGTEDKPVRLSGVHGSVGFAYKPISATDTLTVKHTIFEGLGLAIADWSYQTTNTIQILNSKFIDTSISGKFNIVGSEFYSCKKECVASRNIRSDQVEIEPVVIRNSYFETDGNAVYIFDIASVILQGNTFHSNSTVTVSRGGVVDFSNNTIHGTLELIGHVGNFSVTDNFMSGVVNIDIVSRRGDIELKNNNIVSKSTTIAIIGLKTTEIVISGNYFANGSFHCSLQCALDAQIYNNTFNQLQVSSGKQNLLVFSSIGCPDTSINFRRNDVNSIRHTSSEINTSIFNIKYPNSRMNIQRNLITDYDVDYIFNTHGESTVNATENWFGTVDESEISDRIQNLTIAQNVVFVPYLSARDFDAPLYGVEPISSSIDTSFPVFPSAGETSSSEGHVLSSLPFSSSTTPQVLLTISIRPVSSVDACGVLPLMAITNELESEVVVDEYRWCISSNAGQCIKLSSTSEFISIDLRSYLSGKLNITVEAINSGTTVSDSYVINKPSDRFGNNCSKAIQFDTSFGSVEDHKIQLVNRLSKIYIKSQVDSDAVEYDWSMVPSSRRVKEVQYIKTSTKLPDIVLSSDLPADTVFTIRLRLLSRGELMFYKEILIRTSPSFPISQGELRITPDRSYSGFTGYALKTRFELTAINWKMAVDQPLTYTFQYLDETTLLPVILAKTTNASILSMLPAGFSAKYLMDLKVVVTNEFGDSATSSTVRIRVVPVKVAKETLSSILDDCLNKNNTEFISDAIALGDYINRESGKISKSRAESLYGHMINTLVDHITAKLATSTNTSETQENLGVIDVVTRSTTAVSDTVKYNVLSLLQSVVEQVQNEPAILSTVGQVISNIVAGGFDNSTVSKSTISLANNIAQLLLNQSIATEEAVFISAENFEISSQMNFANSLANRTIAGKNSVKIPESFSTDLSITDSIISYVLMAFSNSPYAYYNSSEEMTASSVVDLTFRYANGSTIGVQELRDPLVLSIRKPNRCDLTGDYAQFVCKYWDEEDHIWKSDGCHWVKDLTTSSSVTCQCNHTTSFSAFVLHKGKCPPIVPGMRISGIVFNGIFIGLCLAVFIGLVLSRGVQPLPSRFLAPWIGISAVLVDSILAGIVKNSLSLAEQWKAADAFSYVVIIAANSLSVAALFVFVYQQVRFLLLQNIYYLMSQKDTSNSSVMKICRVFTSKLVFAGSTLLVFLTVFCYFIALVVVAATRTNQIQTDRLVAILSTSHASFVMFLSLAIFTVLVLDIIISFNRRTVELETESKQEVQRSSEAKGFGLVHAYFRNDPLLFRTEAILIVTTLILLLTLYPIGIVTVFQNTPGKAPTSVARLTIEFLFMFAQIAAFGGFVTAVSVYRYLKRKKNDLMEVGTESSDKSYVEGLFEDPEGRRLFYQYAQLEFSLENYLLYQELEDVRANNLVMSDSERRAFLQRIDHLYMRANAERELNCDNRLKKEFNRVLNMETLSVVDTENIFAKLHSACTVNISDTYIRLTGTREFQIYEQAKRMHSELEDKLELQEA